MKKALALLSITFLLGCDCNSPEHQEFCEIMQDHLTTEEEVDTEEEVEEEFYIIYQRRNEPSTFGELPIDYHVALKGNNGMVRVWIDSNGVVQLLDGRTPVVERTGRILHIDEEGNHNELDLNSQVIVSGSNGILRVGLNEGSVDVFDWRHMVLGDCDGI
jgi:hypothetical protein